ncbi:uncharacterized protein I303_106072 [Kwoniella dejecticola CBS 10117]|uniref:Uncharacterized protein n=1 Tax=Kwoniella dejecticola CBS 10117 TaxID=1296121 RepID=A0A1A6A174_9TREE|nr:uncharacterized protein I303_06092 [Kwoniella dejecticola CBS 10117]OBR83809.1 hypothetical protein I303_06092 [Kwoniella dejecticola CBS 10117]
MFSFNPLLLTSALATIFIPGSLGASEHAKFKINLPAQTKMIDPAKSDVGGTSGSVEFDLFESGLTKTLQWVAVDKKDQNKKLWQVDVTATAGSSWPENDVATYTLKMEEPWAVVDYKPDNAYLKSDPSTFKCFIELCGDAPNF